MQTLFALVVILALFGGGYYWYTQNTAGMGGKDTSETESSGMPIVPANNAPTSSTNEMEVNVDAGVTVGAVKEFNVTNSGFVFNPKEMSVEKGDRVKITYKNGGGTHDLRIDGYGVGTKVLQAGQQETFEFTADKAGTFEFYCSVGNHRAMGMKGTFTVAN